MAEMSGIICTNTRLFVKFTYCMKQLVQIAKKAVFALRKNILLLNLSIDCQSKLFYRTILPISTYACVKFGVLKNWRHDKSHPDKSHPDKSPPNMRQKPPQNIKSKC